MPSDFNKFNQQILLATSLLIILVAAGSTGYVLLEGYTIAEGLYMTIITITTVGFGEVKPLSSLGRIFTSGLILLGFASLAFVGHAVMEAVFNKLLSMKSEKKKMEKKISQLKSHYLICGFGRVGAAAVERFSEVNVNTVIIEANHESYKLLCEKNYLCIEGDAIEEETLVLAGIKAAKGLLAILPSDPDNLFITLTARELNPTLHIIARAQNITSEKKLLQAGANSVISPYTAAGWQIANKMIAFEDSISDLSEIAGNRELRPSLRWVEIHAGSRMVDRAISDVEKKISGRVIGLRRSGEDRLEPPHDSRLQAQDKLLVLDGSTTKPNGHVKQKVVIAEDDRSTMRLYMRLLHRAGFIVLSTNNGRDAVELIVKEKPDAAVLDLMLPKLSGLEICEQVRRVRECNDIKLILFTGDDNPEIKVRAIHAGADAVVVKCAEAAKLINTVKELIKQTSKKKSTISSKEDVASIVKVVTGDESVDFS